MRILLHFRKISHEEIEAFMPFVSPYIILNDDNKFIQNENKDLIKNKNHNLISRNRNDFIAIDNKFKKKTI